MLSISLRLALSFAVKLLKYLLKDYLVYTILVIYLETDLLKKFNLNLGYILIKTLDPDNQENILYKTSYQKLINTFWNDNFLTINHRNKL